MINDMIRIGPVKVAIQDREHLVKMLAGGPFDKKRKAIKITRHF